jgi:hypothetical protein
MKVQTKIKIERVKIGCKKLCWVSLGIVIGVSWYIAICEYEKVSWVSQEVYVITPVQADDGHTKTEYSVTVEEEGAILPLSIEEKTESGLSIEETIQKISKEYNFNWKILYAICLKESNCNPEAIGDEGRALGYYQIHYKMHKVSEKEAKDLQFATEWTLKRLLKYAHLGEYEMIRSHNGLVSWNNYYVDDVYKIMEKL